MSAGTFSRYCASPSSTTPSTNPAISWRFSHSVSNCCAMTGAISRKKTASATIAARYGERDDRGQVGQQNRDCASAAEAREETPNAPLEPRDHRQEDVGEHEREDEREERTARQPEQRDDQ
ncbi:MAG: hypothetical protein MUC34_18840 [Anaerolineae bacterium]|nr:hypothetical protein [Anaerolineae bacterium]